ncbi:MAG TPA: ubiquinol oxidase subunit II [Candidatus Saccharimonadia bacterium]
MNSAVVKVLVVLLLIGGLVGGLVLFLAAHPVAVLDPRGLIASEQRNLIVVTTLLMLLIVVPVFGMTFGIAWKYRAGNTKARYTPDWDHSRVAETLWWGIPSVIIVILAVITWKSSHDLDPFKPLISPNKPVTIQVVALPWKWLFIYPDQNIATVNYVQFPENTPIHFVITADAPMNSFWIPQLGGQIYAMPGMSTQLHLMASEVGSYAGSSANLSGAGFANMRFEAKATTQVAFDDWVAATKKSPLHLGATDYNQLAQPSKRDDVAYYGIASNELYDSIIMKYMLPADGTKHEHGAMQGMRAQ